MAIPLDSPVYADDARSTFRSWLWYAARRRGLALDKIRPDAAAERSELEHAIDSSARSLHLDETLRDAVIEGARLERFGAGEVLLRAGSTPGLLSLVVEGRVLFASRRRARASPPNAGSGSAPRRSRASRRPPPRRH